MIISLVIWNGNVLSPTCIICETFLISVASAIFNANIWKMDLHWNTFSVITGGLILFILTGTIVRMLYNRAISSRNDNPLIVQEIVVEKWKIYLLIILCIVVGFLYNRAAFQLVRNYKSVSSWVEIMYWYRKFTSFEQIEEDIPFVLRQLFFLIGNMGYVCVYILIHNYFATGKINKKLVLSVMATILLFLLGSGRGDIIRFIIVGIVVYEIYYFRVYNLEIRLSPSLLFCILFSGLKQFVGRSDKADFMYYITYYMGESIANLDSYLQENHDPPEIWGKETFYGLNHLNGVLTQDKKYNYSIHKEFRSYQGGTLGNVYTVFRAYINDFGQSNENGITNTVSQNDEIITLSNGDTITASEYELQQSGVPMYMSIDPE